MTKGEETKETIHFQILNEKYVGLYWK